MSTFPSVPAFSDVLNLGIGILRERFPLRRSRHKTYLGDFQVIISLFYMSILRTHGYRNVLHHMAQDLVEALGWDGHTPSASALTQARGHVHADSLQELVSFLYDDSTTARADPTLSYQGRRLLGIDGTRIELPSDDRLRTAFHTNDHLRSERPMPPQAGLVLLEDIGCRLPVAYRITTKRPDERAGLLEMIEFMRPKDVLIADRGFPSREVFRKIVEHGADFIIRMPKNWFLGVDTFIQSGQSDGIFVIDMADKKQQKEGITEALTVRLCAMNIWMKMGSRALSPPVSSTCRNMPTRIYASSMPNVGTPKPPTASSKSMRAWRTFRPALKKAFSKKLPPSLSSKPCSLGWKESYERMRRRR